MNMNTTITSFTARIHSAGPLSVLALLLILAPAEAYALKTSVEMTPDNLQQSGFSMKVKNLEDGTVEFTLSRDLAKARSFAQDSDLQLKRSSTLEVFGKPGLVAKCNVEPKIQENNLTYSFAMARDWVPYSHFQIAEIDYYKDTKREHLIGGGTFYDFRLALFAAQSLAQ